MAIQHIITNFNSDYKGKCGEMSSFIQNLLQLQISLKRRIIYAVLSIYRIAERRDGMGWLVWLLRICFWLFAVYCFLVAPNLFRRKMSNTQLTGHDYAHRGLYDNKRGVPENSLAAFERAVRAGYGIELDVRETRDHQLVVHHDETLERTCGDPRRVCDVPLQELQQLSLFGTREHIPTFDEVLSLVDCKAPLIIELKTDFRNKKLPEQVYAKLRVYRGIYCIESFDPIAVRWFKKHAPRIVRGQLAFMDKMKGLPFIEKVKRFILGCLLIDFLGRPDFIAYGYETDANISFRFVADVFRPLLAAWTVRDEGAYQQLAQEYDIQIFEHFKPVQKLPAQRM